MDKIISDHDENDDKHKCEILFKILIRIDSQIKLKFDLINHRLVWMLVLNSALFVLFAVSVNISNNGCNNRLYIANHIFSIGVLLIVTFSGLIMMAVINGYKAVKEMKEKRSHVERLLIKMHKNLFFDNIINQHLDIFSVGTPPKSIRHKLGHLAAASLPILIACVWMLLWYLMNL